MSYTDVFGNQTLPPSEYGYRSLTIVANVTLQWPYNTDDAATAVAKIMDLFCQSGNEITLPDATLVSTGEDFLIRNVGAFTATVKDASGNPVATIDAGKASYFYLTSNATVAGSYGVVAFGTGTSFVDATQLVGYGIKAIGNSLNQSHPVVGIATPTSIDATYRSKVVVSTAGAITVSLASTVTLGDDFFFFLRNAGSGTLTIDPDGVQTIDGQSSMTVQPGESLILFCSGSSWYTVGYGRSTVYQFSQLVKDVSGGGTFTLTATEASNKLMTFIGNPAGAVTVEVPAVVAVYYLSSEISTAQTITFKTAAGTGIAIPQSARVIALCDGVDVVSAQSVQASTSVSIIDGSVTNPAIFFASQTNTGVYKQGAQGWGVTVNGIAAMTLETALAQIYPPQGYIQLSTTAGAPAHSEGRLFFDNGEHTLAYFNEVNGITVNVGQEVLVRVRNNTGATILNGSVVYVNGAVGNRPTVALALGNASATSMGTLGVATHDIANGADGYITAFGNVNDLNLNAYAEGTILWLSAVTPGGLTNVQPVAPNHAVVIGYVTRQHLTQGRLFVRIETGDSLSSLHDVYLPAPANNNMLRYVSANSRWEAVDFLGTANTWTAKQTISSSDFEWVSGGSAIVSTGFVGCAYRFNHYSGAANSRKWSFQSDNIAFGDLTIATSVDQVSSPTLVRWRISPSGNVEHANFTKLGESSPAIKVKKLTGTTAAAEGGQTTVAHGITASKVLGIQALVFYATNAAITPEYAYQFGAGYQFSVVLNPADVRIDLDNANSENILSKPFVVLVTYEE